MGGTVPFERLREVAHSSLSSISETYTRRPGGDLQFDGERPGPGWHAHGWFPRRLWMLRAAIPFLARVWKRRWRRGPGGPTCHSRPPEDVASAGACSLLIVLRLWAWVDSSQGLPGYEEVFEDLSGWGSARTTRRWLRRALPRALEAEQAIRRAVIERSEPQPVEQLFPQGLSPPKGWSRHRWREPLAVSSLWRALALLLVGATGLSVQTPTLLAEARDWSVPPPAPFPI